MASNKFLEETGLSRLWANTKGYVNDTISTGVGGGENLLLGTSNQLKSISLSSWGNYTGASTNGHYFAVEPSTTYTARIYLKASTQTTCIGISYYKEGNVAYNHFLGSKINADSEGYSTLTFTTDAFTTVIDVYAVKFTSADTPNNTVQYKELKLERGAIATPWSLAPSETLIEFNDFQCLNGTSNGDTQVPIRLINFPTFQLMSFNLWLNYINLTGSWKSKQVVSIPLKYLRFKNATNISGGAPEYFDSNAVVEANLDAETGIITATNRTVDITNTRLKQVFLIYDSKTE